MGERYATQDPNGLSTTYLVFKLVLLFPTDKEPSGHGRAGSTSGQDNVHKHLGRLNTLGFFAYILFLGALRGVFITRVASTGVIHGFAVLVRVRLDRLVVVDRGGGMRSELGAVVRGHQFGM